MGRRKYDKVNRDSRLRENALVTAVPNDYTPALGIRMLTPLYDAAIGALTREKTWRAAMVREVAPVSEDCILDIGCGTASLLLALARAEPRASYLGIDPDAEVLARATAKAKAAGAAIAFVQGFAADDILPQGWRPTKIVSSLVLHQVPLTEKRRILEVALDMLIPGGGFHLADYGAQDEAFMRILFRNTVQRLDGIADTQPNADGILPRLMADAGFVGIDERARVRTSTGMIRLYSAQKPAASTKENST